MTKPLHLIVFLGGFGFTAQQVLSQDAAVGRVVDNDVDREGERSGDGNKRCLRRRALLRQLVEPFACQKHTSEHYRETPFWTWVNSKRG